MKSNIDRLPKPGVRSTDAGQDKHYVPYRTSCNPVVLKEEEWCDTISVMIPGFQKEDFVVQVINNILFIKISNCDYRLVNTNQRSYPAIKAFKLNPSVTVSRIIAKYDGEVLRFRMPKMNANHPFESLTIEVTD